MAELPLGALDNPLNVAVLLVLAVLLFGKQLPDVMRAFGKGIRDLRQTANFEDMSDALKAVNDIRTVATPGAIARAALPGAAEIQDSLAETRGLALASEPIDATDEVAPVRPIAPPPEPEIDPAKVAAAPPFAGTQPVPPPSEPWVERLRIEDPPVGSADAD